MSEETRIEETQIHFTSLPPQTRVLEVQQVQKFQQVPPRRNQRGTSVQSLLAAFLAGSLVVGSLMFTADRLNLFSGSNVTSSAISSTSANSDMQTASLNVTTGANSIADIVKQASPAVVKIETTARTTSFSRNNQEASGIGSGFIFDSTGYILTNEHVIDGAAGVKVYVQGYDEPFTAKLLGSSYDLDLAVLKIDNAAAFPTITIGATDNSQPGDIVVAIGNPYDFDYTVTSGVLSAKNREISIDDQQGTRNYKNLIQTDTAINPGNSGGPLLNMNGEVIGINTAVSSDAQGIGFAISTDTIRSVIDQLKNNITIPQEASPYIGVSLVDLTTDMLNQLQLNSTDGAIVAAVQQGAPANQAGIRQYDVIIAINGTKVTNSEELTKAIQTTKVGDSLKLEVVRDGQTQDIKVEVGDKAASGD